MEQRAAVEQRAAAKHRVAVERHAAVEQRAVVEQRAAVEQPAAVDWRAAVNWRAAVERRAASGQSPGRVTLYEDEHVRWTGIRRALSDEQPVPRLNSVPGQRVATEQCMATGVSFLGKTLKGVVVQPPDRPPYGRGQ